ncbi:transposase [Blautia fusiformis]
MLLTEDVIIVRTISGIKFKLFVMLLCHMRSSFSMPLLYHAYVYLEFLILACTIYILAPNRTVRINRELTAMHQEVIENLESIQGALLRMNRSIQAEGTFGIIKNDRWYKRIVRRGIKSVLLEVFLVSIGHNLYKYYNKQKKATTAA